MTGAEIITLAQMRAIDAAAARAGVPTRTLMENAGRAVADAIAARFTPRPTAVICGPGANGGDGWVAARALQERGWPVWVETLAAPVELLGDPFDAAQAFKGEVLRVSELNPRGELIVDAMFGAGLARALDGEAARLALQMAQTPERVVAIDIPSGLQGDSATPLGEACVRAGLTVTFVRKKPAHVLYPGRAFCGDVVLADIGAPEAVVAEHVGLLWENGPALWGARFPWPDPQTHKHQRGAVAAATGGFGRTGAARLAARAALRAGAGLVTLLAPADAMVECAAQIEALMLRQTDGADALAAAALQAQALVVGPGFGVEAEHGARLAAAMDAAGRPPCVLDADALTLLARMKKRRFDPRDVLTPHVGEFNRLFPGLLDQVGRLEAARQAAQRVDCVVLLKGPDSVVAAPDGRTVINTSGAPFLATAGAGDVLAGIIAALIAQGMASFEATAAAAWLHGRAGEALGAGLIAEDLPGALAPVLDAIAPAALKRPAR